MFMSIGIIFSSEFLSIWLMTEIMIFMNSMIFIKDKMELYLIFYFFFIQFFSSLIMILTVLIQVKIGMNNLIWEMKWIIFLLGFFLKSSLFPFFWLLNFGNSVSWMSLILINSFPKIISLIYFMIFMMNYSFFYLHCFLILNSLIFFYIFQENSLILIMMISGIFNLFLMILFFDFDKCLSWFYFFIYIFLSISLMLSFKKEKVFFLSCLNKFSISNSTYMMMILLLLMGTPPLIMFLLKFLFLNKIIFLSHSMSFLFIFIILSDLVMTMYYMYMFMFIMMSQKNLLMQYYSSVNKTVNLFFFFNFMFLFFF